MNIISFILLFLAPLALDQELGTKLPKGVFVEQGTESPSTYILKRNTLIVKTDPFLHYGYQYTGVYKIKWIDATHFRLKVKRKYTKDNNVERSRRKRRHRKKINLITDNFNVWTFLQNKDSSYSLIGTDNKYSKKDSVVIKLVLKSDE